MYVAMQMYMEGSRTFCNAIRVKPFPTLEAAKKVALLKAKGVPYVAQGVKVVWSPVHDRLSK